MDLNCSGVGLMEIVSKPDIRSAEEAKAYVTKLRTIMRYLGTCDGNMEEGSLRADVNVSVRRPGAPLGTRCEIKNVNSIRFIGQAIEHEARRQIDILEDGGSIKQETRLFDAKAGTTRSMRSKEEAHDYRYFPDPDLLPLELTDAFVKKLAKALPELPDEKRARFMKDYALSAYDAGVLISDRASADFFETVAKGRDAKLAANWIMGDFFAALNKTGKDISDSPVPAAHLGELIDLISSNVISGRIAKEVFELMLETGHAPASIVEERGLTQVTDTGAIEKVVDEIIAANPKQVEQVQTKPKTLGWFVGQVMRATGGKANPDAVNAILRVKLKVRRRSNVARVALDADKLPQYPLSLKHDYAPPAFPLILSFSRSRLLASATALSRQHAKACWRGEGRCCKCERTPSPPCGRGLG